MLWQNWTVRIGGIALALLLLFALAAPWLGTVDPNLFDAASRDLRPGAAREIMTLEGETLKHTFLMGSDSFGRDIYSRVLYGTRVSLIVGLAAALLAAAFGIVLGLCAGYIRWLTGRRCPWWAASRPTPATRTASGGARRGRRGLPPVTGRIAS